MDNKVLNEVQNLIIANVSTIRLTYEAEDEKRAATMAELMEALNTASVEDLEKFLVCKNKHLFFADGYISVKF